MKVNGSVIFAFHRDGNSIYAVDALPGRALVRLGAVNFRLGGWTSVDKLIISHGDRVTEHVLRDSPLVIGRDPECDLFFADKKLSRHHARIERVGFRFRLVDLGSRNGSWVNRERVDERDVEPGDEIRLGGLRISIERAFGDRPADESTTYLGEKEQRLPDTRTLTLDPSRAGEYREAPEPATSTVAFSPASAPKPAPGPDDSSTVYLPAAQSSSRLEVGDADETLKKPESERTAAFPGQSRPRVFDTGTVLYRGKADPSLSEAARSATRQKTSREIELVPDEETSEPVLNASVTYVPPPAGAGRSWTMRFTYLVAGLGAFAILVLGLPLLRILSTAVVEESQLRAQALVDLLTAANEEALGGGRVADVSIERVVGEPGVTGAYVLTPTGQILAPRDQAGQQLELPALRGSTGDIRALRSGWAENGDLVLAQPVVYQGRRVGVAVLTHDSAAASMLAGLVFLLGALLVLMAVVVTVLIAKKMTVNPLNDLRLEVEEVDGGKAASLSAQRPYTELCDLVSSLNHLLESHGISPAPGSRESSRSPVQH